MRSQSKGTAISSLRQNQQMAAYQLNTGQSSNLPISITARRDNDGLQAHNIQIGGSQTQLSQQRLTAPVKSLQAKHRQLEHQLAKLSEEVAAQKRDQLGQNKLEVKRRTFINDDTGNPLSPVTTIDGPKKSFVHGVNSGSSLRMQSSSNTKNTNFVANVNITSSANRRVVTGPDTRSMSGKRKLGKKHSQQSFKVPNRHTNQEHVLSPKPQAQTNVNQLSAKKRKQFTDLIDQLKKKDSFQNQTPVNLQQLSQKKIKASIIMSQSNKNRQINAAMIRQISQNNNQNQSSEYVSTSEKKSDKILNLNQPQIGSLRSMIGLEQDQDLNSYADAKSSQQQNLNDFSNDDHNHGFGDAYSNLTGQMERNNSAQKSFTDVGGSPCVLPKQLQIVSQYSGEDERPLSDFEGDRPISDLAKGLESGILNLHAHLKTLEGKYIDLANFYKQELIMKQVKRNQKIDNSQEVYDLRPSSSNTAQRRGGTSQNKRSVINSGREKSQSRDQFIKKTPKIEQRGNSYSLRHKDILEYNAAQLQSNQHQRLANLSSFDQNAEKSIIDEVKSQKLKLENELRNLINIHSAISDEEMVHKQTLQPLDRQLLDDVDQQSSSSHRQLEKILKKSQNMLQTQQEYGEISSSSIKTAFEQLASDLATYIKQIFARSQTVNQNKVSRSGNYQNLPVGLLDRIDKLSGEYEIEQEYSLSSIREQIFQIQHANEQVKLDVKKIGLDFNSLQRKMQALQEQISMLVGSAQNNGAPSLSQSSNQQHYQGSNHSNNAVLQSVGLTNLSIGLDEFDASLSQIAGSYKQLGSRITKSEKSIENMNSGHATCVSKLHQYRAQFKEVFNQIVVFSSSPQVDQSPTLHHSMSLINANQSSEITTLNQELLNLRMQLADAKQSGLLDLQEMREKLEDYSQENQKLYTQLDSMRHEIVKKDESIQQKNRMYAHLTERINNQKKEDLFQIPDARIFDEDWVHSCQDIVDLVTKFLHSMRRLQKAVHRRETNVIVEKQDFEQSKKDLESKLKEVKRKLENRNNSSQVIQHSQAYIDAENRLIAQKEINVAIKNNAGIQESSANISLKAASQPTTSAPQHQNQPANLLCDTPPDRLPLSNFPMASSNPASKLKPGNIFDQLRQYLTNFKNSNSQLQVGVYEEEQASEMKRQDKEANMVSSLQIVDQLEQKMASMETQISQMEAENSKQNMLNAVITTLQKKLDEQKTQSEFQFEEFTSQVQHQEEEITVLRAKVDKKRDKAGRTKQVLASMSAESDKNRADYEQTEAKLKDAKSSMKQLQSELEVKDKQCMEIREESSQLKGLNKQIQHDYDILQSKFQVTIDELRQIRSEKEILNEKLALVQADSQSDITKQTLEISNLRKALADVQAQVSDKQVYITELEQEKELIISDLNKAKEAIKSKDAKIGELKDKHAKEMEITRKETRVETLADASLNDLRSANNQNVVFDFNELDQDLQAARAQVAKLDQSMLDLKSQIDASLAKEATLQNQLKQAEDLIDKAQKEYSKQEESLSASIAQLETKMSNLTDKLSVKESELNKQTEILTQKEAQISSLTQIQANLEQQLCKARQESERIQGDLRKERDQAQTQLQEFINQTKLDKESLEGKLQHQLNQTLDMLNQKEIDCEELQTNLTALKDLQVSTEQQLEQTKANLASAETTLANLRSQNELTEQKCTDYVETLEQNRELIQMLKRDLEHNIEQVNDLQTECLEFQAQIEVHKDNEIAKSRQINEKEKEIEGLERQIAEKDADLVRIDQENEEYQSTITSLRQETKAKIDQLTQEIAEKQEIISQQRDASQANMKELQSLQEQLNEVKNDQKSKIQQKQEDEVRYEKSLSQKTQELDKTIAQLKTLEDQNNTLQAEISKLLQEQSDVVSRKETESESFRNELLRLQQENSVIQEKKDDAVQRLTKENDEFREAIAALKLQFEERTREQETIVHQLKKDCQSKDEQIEEATEVLTEFNQEKHEVKAKVKHLMQLLTLKASLADQGSQTDAKDASEPIDYSTYKGRENEVDLNHCFEELERVLREYLATQESRFEEMKQDRDELAGKVNEKTENLEAMHTEVGQLRTELNMVASTLTQDDHAVYSSTLNVNHLLASELSEHSKVKTEMDELRNTLQSQEARIIELKQELQICQSAEREATVALLALQDENNKKKDELGDSAIEESILALRKENNVLLQRLQKAEGALQKARMGQQDSDEEEAEPDFSKAKPDHSKPQVEAAPNQEVLDKLTQMELRLGEVKNELHGAKDACLQILHNKAASKINEIRQAFVDSAILQNKLRDDKVVGWNNFVKECKQVQFQNKIFLLIKTLKAEPDEQFVMVEEDKLTPTAQKYLKAFIEDYSDDEFVSDVIGNGQSELETDPEIQKLMALVADLRQDCVELGSELTQLREGGKNDMSKMHTLKQEELVEEIEYLTGENKELSLKVKSVCLTNAELKLNLAKLNTQQQLEQDQRDMSAILAEENAHMPDASAIEAVKGIGLDDRMFSEVDDEGNKSEAPQLMEADNADDDSVMDVVNVIDNQVDPTDALREQLETAHEQIESLALEISNAKMKIQELEEKSAQKSGDPLDEEEDYGGAGSLLPHIKSTLIQFLRHVPLSDQKYEDILPPIYSMMAFTKEEIQELRQDRIRARQDSKTGKPARGNSTAKGNSSNMSYDDEGKPKKKGLLGVFGFKKSGANDSSGAGAAGGSTGTISSLKPLPRR